jgi:ornithine carbamoyltransferase
MFGRFRLCVEGRLRSFYAMLHVVYMVNLYGKDLITTQDWSIDELTTTIKLAEKFRNVKKAGKLPPKSLERKNFFMLFWAPSTRTRAAFEAGMELLGGHAAYVDVGTTRIMIGESLQDAARMYDAYGDGIGIRILDEAIDFVYGRGQRVVREFAKVAKIPVINLGCCTHHPTQALGDIMTVKRKMGNLKRKKYTITWAYSRKLRGRCSIQEELLIATRFGMDVVIAYPREFDIDPTVLTTAKKNAEVSGGSLELSHDFNEALRDADVVFPRSWVSSRLSEVGKTAFGVDNEVEIHNRYKKWRLEQTHVDDLMSKRAILTHVLPVFRGEEVNNKLVEAPNSVIYEQAEDGLYAKMAVLTLTMDSRDVLNLAETSANPSNRLLS